LLTNALRISLQDWPEVLDAEFFYAVGWLPQFFPVSSRAHFGLFGLVVN